MDHSLPIDWFPLLLSLRVALLATALVLFFGTALAYLLSHREFRGKNLLDAAITLPLVLPPTVLGYYLLVLVGRASPLGQVYETIFGQPLVFTWQAAVVAAFLHSAPIYIKAARTVLEGVDYHYEWAAHSLGASEWRTFWRITLPLAKRGLVSLGTLSFARSLGDFGLTIMVAGNIPGRTCLSQSMTRLNQETGAWPGSLSLLFQLRPWLYSGPALTGQSPFARAARPDGD